MLKAQRLARDASGGRLMRCAGVYMDNDVANGDDDDADHDCDDDADHGCDDDADHCDNILERNVQEFC